MILDQCAIKQLLKLDGMDEKWAEEFGLNYAQMRSVQDAVAGSEETGYSQALLRINGEWSGMRSERYRLKKPSSTTNPNQTRRSKLPFLQTSSGEESTWLQETTEPTPRYG